MLEYRPELIASIRDVLSVGVSAAYLLCRPGGVRCVIVKRRPACVVTQRILLRRRPHTPTVAKSHPRGTGDRRPL
ncbi:hypothetical protein EVAR_22312_1 [Eumeta japonica]|uniref:Uncharacterized protein n=1 Tax=Eumeta variegata TaxID=151549 RepID=A0A4C1UBY5_EUMVA|nr:hypothetical protein EVAR_22312_1 [Eumeta japonica]